MKKVFALLFALVLVLSILSAVLAETCDVDLNAQRPNRPPKICGASFGSEKYEMTAVTNGSHYVYDNNGNRVTCSYLYNTITYYKKCKNGHKKTTGTYTNSFNHSSRYCSEY